MRLATVAFLTSVLLSLLAGQSFALEHTFISTVGTDTGDCNRANPCRTINYAEGQTMSGGVLTLLGEGDFSGGGGDIENSITIEGQGPGTRIYNAGTAGVKFFTSSGRLVLRNLSIGSDFGSLGPVGVQFFGASLRMENITIFNLYRRRAESQETKGSGL